MARDDDYDDYEAGGGSRRRTESWPHSGVGIASFVAGIVALLMIVGAFGLAVVAIAGDPHAKEPPREAFALIGLLMVGGGLVALIGTGLGIGSCCQGERKKVFGVIGLVMNGLLLLGGIGVILIGVLASAAK